MPCAADREWVNLGEVTAPGLDDSRTREAFGPARKCVVIYGVMSAVTLATVAALPAGGALTSRHRPIRILR
ncbi:hypothetical protein ACGFJC_10880 [Nonomuraea fuscirosea]|uniref:hypothetical protein n=1 Tax=Nonomuraea fuscirosea TaxID=1291556 RepID=UPI00342CD1BE